MSMATDILNDSGMTYTQKLVKADRCYTAARAELESTGGREKYTFDDNSVIYFQDAGQNVSLT